MSRATRLLELMIRLEARPRFSVSELADEFGVARRTMLRDLQALSAMGVPLASSPGPGGGYWLIRDRRVLPLHLTVDEALGMLLAYEDLLQYAESPFADQNLSAITKLRAALPPPTITELDRIRRHLAIISRQPDYRAPLLAELLRAALDQVHLRIEYDGRSGPSHRVIFPFGLFARHGFWYCACHDDRRGRKLTLRADRVLSVERVERRQRPEAVDLNHWFETIEQDDESGLPLRILVSPAGMKNFDLRRLFPRARETAEGGIIEGSLPRSEIGWFASQLLPVGLDARVESPPELIDAMRAQAAAILARYGIRSSASERAE